MTKIVLLIFLNCYLFMICHAQRNARNRPPAAPVPRPKPLTTSQSATIPPPLFERTAPKCYPETATAYFLPAPPSAPKITILNTNLKDAALKDLGTKNSNFEEIISTGKSVPPILAQAPTVDRVPPTNKIISRGFSPPPPCLSGLPDLIDEIPSIMQDRFSRFANSEEKPVCESCANLIKKLPIFNFDQELLDGFLAAIGL